MAQIAGDLPPPPPEPIVGLPVAGSRPQWVFSDFFKIDATEEHKIKLGLASHFKIRYDTVNGSSDCALSVDGIAPYDPDAIEKRHKAYDELLKDLPRNLAKRRPTLPRLWPTTRSMHQSSVVVWCGGVYQRRS